MNQSRAIVLHQLKYSETSLILKIYTEKEGLLSFIVKGVRGKKGRIRSAQLQHLSILDLVYYEARKSQLRMIKDLKVDEPFVEIPYDPVKRSIALFITELLLHSIREEEENRELYSFLYASIHWLDLTKISCTHFHLLFMMKLTKYLGFYPMFDRHENEGYFDLQSGTFAFSAPPHPHYIDGDELQAWKALLNCSYENLDKLHFANSLKRSMVQQLMDYYKLHLVNFKELNSHHILQMVFDDE